jgi:hypothetical protein
VGSESKKKIEEKEFMKRAYITMFVGLLFGYLNFAKNPFN